MMRNLHFLAFLVFISTPITIANVAFACGSVEKNFGIYQAHTNKSEVESFLKSQSCGSAVNYSPLYAEPVIARVLANAIGLGVSEENIEGVFKRYNCLSTTRNQEEYRKIADFLGQDKLENDCNPEKFKKMYIVSSISGANLRAEPSKKAKKIGTVAESVLVTNGTVHGDWVLVDTYSGTGYMHSSTLKPYLTDD